MLIETAEAMVARLQPKDSSSGTIRTLGVTRIAAEPRAQQGDEGDGCDDPGEVETPASKATKCVHRRSLAEGAGDGQGSSLRKRDAPHARGMTVQKVRSWPGLTGPSL
jgi:hypothetical protein